MFRRAFVLPGICISYITFITAEVNAQEDSSSSPQATGSASAVLERRQYSPSPFLTAPLPVLSSSSSSFDYWWPYPPASSQDPSTVLTSSSESADDESTSDLAPYIFASLTETLLPAYSSISNSSTSPETATTSNGNLTLVNSYSIISITALPPLNTTSVNPHGSHVISGHQKPLNTVVLISVFVIIGVVLGAAFGWWSYGVFIARKKRLLAGPQYSGVNHNEEFDEKDGTQPDEVNATVFNESESLLDRKSSRATTFTTHLRERGQDASEPPVAATSINHWPSFSLGILKSPLITGIVNDQRNKAHLTEPLSAYTGLEKSYLHTSASSVFAVYRNSGTHLDVEAENSSLGIEDCISPYAPTVFESVATSDEDEDYELARRVVLDRHGTGSIRKKSIRKRLAEKLEYFGLKQSVARRGTQKRGRTPEMEEGVLLQSEAESTQDSPSYLKRKRSSTTGGWQSHGRAISDFSLVDVNIRAPAATHLRNPLQFSPKRTGMGVLDAVRSYTSPLRPSQSDDKFTELPKRKRTTRRLKTARRPEKNPSPRADDEYDDEIGEKENKFILPASPPTVSSPQLDTDLFFGATPPVDTCTSDSISSRQRVHNLREASESPTSFKLHGERIQVRSGLCGPRRMVKEASGLASYKEKALPPSPPRRASRRCSSNSPAKHRSRAAQKQRERSGTVPSRPMSPKERYEARRTAHRFAQCWKESGVAIGESDDEQCKRQPPDFPISKSHKLALFRFHVPCLRDLNGVSVLF